MKDLKNCPFCGGDGATHKHEFLGDVATWVTACSCCGCLTRPFYATEEQAIEAWNRRTDNGTN